MSGAGWAVVAAGLFLAGFGGFGIGDWRRAGVLDAVEEETRADIYDRQIEYLLDGYELRLVPAGDDDWNMIWWRRADVVDVRDLPVPAVQPPGSHAVDRGALPPAVPAGPAGPMRDPELDVPRPGHGAVGEMPRTQARAVSSGPLLAGEPAAAGHTGNHGETAGPGRLPSQDTYRAELAKLAGDDPAPWLAALIAPEPTVEPGPPPELAWLERLLYKGAMSTAWCTSVIESLVPSFAEDVAATDRAIARWAEEARWELIGRRQWPLPGMVTA